MPRRSAVRAALVSAGGVGLLATAAPAAQADDEDDPCWLLEGPAKAYCEEEEGGSGSGGGGDQRSDTEVDVLDPLQALAKGCAKGAGWVIDKLAAATEATGSVDFTNGSFVTTYSLVFACSTFLTLLLWLWAVVKRAVRGVPLTTAMGEAIGLLWITVLASAFTPLILYTVVSAVDGLTLALAGESGDSAGFFGSFADAVRESAESTGGGGPIVSIVLSLIAMAAAGVVWFELVIRAALLYVGAVLGTVVYSGLVDKDLWGRVKKWLGIMTAIILVKPIIVIVLRLAAALSGGEGAEGAGAIVSGLAIIVIAIMASAMLFRMIPGMGDDIVAARRDSYDPASRQSLAAVTRPVTSLRQGIATHAARDETNRAQQQQSNTTTAASTASSGMSAHASRPTGSQGTPRQRDNSS